MTVAKYVTVYKQRGIRGNTGVRNTKRFISKNTESAQPLDGSIKSGDFFFSKMFGVIEILQLCRGKSFLHQTSELNNINFIGIPYKRQEETQVHFACPSFTMKYYAALEELYKEKVRILLRLKCQSYLYSQFRTI